MFSFEYYNKSKKLLFTLLSKIIVNFHLKNMNKICNKNLGFFILHFHSFKILSYPTSYIYILQNK